MKFSYFTLILNQLPLVIWSEVCLETRLLSLCSARIDGFGATFKYELNNFGRFRLMAKFNVIILNDEQCVIHNLLQISSSI